MLKGMLGDNALLRVCFGIAKTISWRSSRAATAKSKSKIQKINGIAQFDGILRIPMIAFIVDTSKETERPILHDGLKVTKVYAEMTSTNLTQEQKDYREGICSDILIENVKTSFVHNCHQM